MGSGGCDGAYSVGRSEFDVVDVRHALVLCLSEYGQCGAELLTAQCTAGECRAANGAAVQHRAAVSVGGDGSDGCFLVRCRLLFGRPLLRLYHIHRLLHTTRLLELYEG